MHTQQAIDRIEGAVEALADACTHLHPDQIPADRIAGLHRTLGRAERVAAGSKIRRARRLADTADMASTRPAQWIAEHTGTTLTDARNQIRISEDLPHHPHLDTALGTGTISTRQVNAIAAAVTANPAAEQELVGRAASGTSDLGDLRRRARHIIADADPDPDATRARHHRRRAFTTWTDDDGQWHGHLNGPAEAGAAIMAAIKDTADAAFATAHTEGRREAPHAYAFDGLLDALSSGDSVEEGRSSRGRERKVIGVVDVAALQRDQLEPGDRCELTGVGPVSLSAMRDLLGEATVAVLIKKDTVDLAVAHLGRHPTAFQRTAIKARGYVCSINGCSTRTNLEIDHTRDWATTHRTETHHLDWLCTPHHRAKSQGQLTLTGTPDHRTTTPTRQATARAP